MTPLLHACAFDDLAGIRLFDSRIYVRRPVAGTRITGTTLAAKLFAPGPVRVVLADKADAEADGTIGIDHGMKKKRAGLAPKIASIPRASVTPPVVCERRRPNCLPVDGLLQLVPGDAKRLDPILDLELFVHVDLATVALVPFGDCRSCSSAIAWTSRSSSRTVSRSLIVFSLSLGPGST
ncbi:hypothetical protein ABIB66_003062 [Bradyrhizobium sp. F1.13.3]